MSLIPRKGKKRSMEGVVIPLAPDGDCCYLPLSQGKFALVDRTDFEWLNQWNWAAIKSGNTYYATRSSGILMHREILKPPTNLEVDHVNGDGLDNRRANLRAVTRTENLRHRNTFRNNKSGFKGVSFNPVNGKWRATLNIGTYDSAEEAAQAYDKVIRRLFGSLAKTNFNDMDES